jgi:hypothetical protein
LVFDGATGIIQNDATVQVSMRQQCSWASGTHLL